MVYNSNYSLTSLKRWSCKSKELPPISAVKSIHVYDFDNTLFSSPMPNPQLWHPSVLGLLQTYEVFANGGWWHEPGILGATGEGTEKEEPKAWEGWWNETVVQLVEASMGQKDVLTILLTGRGETNFANLINRMSNAKKLDFDMVVLKPEVGPQGQRFSSTLEFKTEYFRELVFTYKNADEVRVYEDRPKHVKSFREYFEKLNKSLLSHPADQPPPSRKPITAEVIHVCELKATLDPEVEVIAVQTAMNRHNRVIQTGGPNPCGAQSRLLQIKENFVYFGYLISQHDSARLLTLCNTPAHLVDSGEVRYMASNILIAPFYPRKEILDKVGGRGNKVTWQVTGIAKFEDRIWAARVAPVDQDQPIYTQDPTPLVVLAIRKGARPIDAARIQNWQPVAAGKDFIFQTVVGDRIMLKIEELDEESHRGKRRGYGGVNKRKFGHEDESFQNEAGTGKENARNGERQGQGQNQGQGQGRYFSGKREQFNNRRGNNQNNQNKNQGGNNNNNRRQNNNQQGGNQGRPRGGGRGNGPAYKSLDDYGGGNFDGAGDNKTQQEAMVMDY